MRFNLNLLLTKGGFSAKSLDVGGSCAIEERSAGVDLWEGQALKTVASAMKKLGKIHHHRALEIVSISSDCTRAGRLASLGFLPGSRIRISRVAPLGDPISIEMEGQEISVRRAEANLIDVKEVA